MANSKEAIKNIIGEIPYTAELYWLLRHRKKPFQSRFAFKLLPENMNVIIAQAHELRNGSKPRKRIFSFATLHYWIEHAALLGIALASQGHDVTLGFLPYAEWKTPINRFDLRRQNLYAKRILEKTEPFIHPISLLNVHVSSINLPPQLEEAVREVTVNDVQYTSQVEDVDVESNFYKLRWHRNEHAARAVLAILQEQRPDLVITPNGTIQEFGVVYRVAKYLGLPVVTYEFGEQKERVWIAKDSEVMQQETDALWEARKSRQLTESQLKKIRELYAARQKGSLWENFARRWQGTPTQGANRIRKQLRLDDRPIVLLPTNVVGDSLTLGRQVFTKTMTEWLKGTIQYFAGRPDVQLIIRVHPGEMLLKGVSITEIIHREMPKLPEHVHLVGPKEDVNTYDLISIADLGLVYTTTVGMEMALSGVPVIVSGKTHYRHRGFTMDPDSWVNYFKTLGQLLCNIKKHRLTKSQVESAWRYAYYFFFDFPRPFPWHLWRLKEDYTAYPLKYVVSKAGRQKFGTALEYFAGTPIEWTKIR
jgi:hypothetical protein